MPLNPPPLIESAQLRVRRLERADLPGLLPINGDPLVTRYLPYAAWTSIGDAEAWYARMEALQQDRRAIQWVIAEREHGTLIGTCLLFRYEQPAECAELGYVLGRAWWGRGLMQEALGALMDWVFRDTSVRRLEAYVDARNSASAALLGRLGFQAEGRLRERWCVGTQWVDALVFGRLRAEHPLRAPAAGARRAAGGPDGR